MIDAEFNFDAKEWQDLLTRLKKKWDYILVGTSGVRKEFSELASIFVFKDIMDHFENESGPKGQWVWWSDAYTAHLNKIGRGGNKILQFNGRLKQSFTANNWKSTNDGVLFYNNAKTSGGFPYAAAHDRGGEK